MRERRNTHIKYQSLSLQEALAIEREIEAQITEAFEDGIAVATAMMRAYCTDCENFDILCESDPVSELEH